MNEPRLIIFDCDGVLIDSEIVVCRLVSEVLTRLGYRISLNEVVRRFAGRPEREMIAEIEGDWGRPVPPEYFPEMRALIARAYATELRAVAGAAETLARLRVPFCVASSSDPHKLRLGLESVGLQRLFEANIVSATFVARGKPAPDVFIYAAGWMRTSIADCLVAEDSIPGVRVPRAAGLRVLGFIGASHCDSCHSDRLIEAGAEAVMERFPDLETLVPSAFRGEAPAGQAALAPAARELL